MSNQQVLESGGWFDPDSSQVLMEWTGYLDPTTGQMLDDPTPNGLYTRSMRLYRTRNGSLVYRWPKTYFSNPALIKYVNVTAWFYKEISSEFACELMTRELEWQAAQKWFPNEFSAEFACECLIKRGKEKEARKHFSQVFSVVWNKVHAGER